MRDTREPRQLSGPINNWWSAIPLNNDLQYKVITYEQDDETWILDTRSLVTSDLCQPPSPEEATDFVEEFVKPFALKNHKIFQKLREGNETAVLEHRVLARHGLGNLAVNFQAHRLRQAIYSGSPLESASMVEEGFIHEDWNWSDDWDLFQICRGTPTRFLRGLVTPLLPDIYADDEVEESIDFLKKFFAGTENLPFDLDTSSFEDIFQGIRHLRDTEYRRQLAEVDAITEGQLKQDTIFSMRGVFHWMPKILETELAGRYFANDIVTKIGDLSDDLGIINELVDPSLDPNTPLAIWLHRFDGLTDDRKPVRVS